jgi:APA family basic amino acid/polyamine antiporter
MPQRLSGEEKKRVPQVGLRKEIRAHHFFTIGFGCIIGVGWIIILGEWLKSAGPLGSMIAFAVGAIVMMVIGLCYAELATMMPVTGGEIAYAYEIYGLKVSYFVGWFLGLAYISSVSFEAVSGAWILDNLIGDLRGPLLYVIRGEPVYLGNLIFSLGGTVFLAFLNFRGLRQAAIFQNVTTYGIIIIALIFIPAGIVFGKGGNLDPLFSETAISPVILGILSVFIVVPFMYSGFQAIPQVMEEKAQKTSLALAGKTIFLSIGAAGIFYVLVILSASMVSPWKDLLGADLPAAAAFKTAFNSPLFGRVVLLAGFLGIVTTWNTVFIAGSRVIFAFGRARIIPSTFARVHPRFETPHIAILFTGVIASLGILLGRSAILPIVNVAGGGYALAFIFSCLGVAKLRRKRPSARRPYRAPGGIVLPIFGFGLSVLMVFLTIYQPYVNSPDRFPMEWAIIIIWTLLGILFWVLARKIRSQINEEDRRKLIFGHIPGSAEDPENMT